MSRSCAEDSEEPVDRVVYLTAIRKWCCDDYGVLITDS